jgi:acetoin utilization deacetylase AcuC-like enzyme
LLRRGLREKGAVRKELSDREREAPGSAAGAGDPPQRQAPLALVDDALFDEHRARGYHPERPERLVAARRAIAAATERGVEFARLGPRDAEADELAGVHTDAYVELLERYNGLFAALDDDTYLTPRSVAAAYRAAGGAVALVDQLLAPTGPDRGVAILRPPGHHARPDRGMGFCLFNNVAVAAARARARGVGRVAIVDWDVHHGNGTQEIFYRDPNVLFVSMHQYPFYPGTGRAAEVGEGDGTGFTVNVPLSSDAGDAAYRATFEELVLPVLSGFAPELVLVSAGFDAHARDPLAGMTVTDRGFGWMASELRRVADRSAQGKIALFLEGGYDLEGLESSLESAIGAVAGLEAWEGGAAGAVSATHSAEIAEARKRLLPHWRL